MVLPNGHTVSPGFKYPLANRWVAGWWLGLALRRWRARALQRLCPAAALLLATLGAGVVGVAVVEAQPGELRARYPGSFS